MSVGTQRHLLGRFLLTQSGWVKRMCVVQHHG